MHFKIITFSKKFNETENYICYSHNKKNTYIKTDTIHIRKNTYTYIKHLIHYTFLYAIIFLLSVYNEKQSKYKYIPALDNIYNLSKTHFYPNLP